MMSSYLKQWSQIVVQKSTTRMASKDCIDFAYLKKQDHPSELINNQVEEINIGIKEPITL